MRGDINFSSPRPHPVVETRCLFLAQQAADKRDTAHAAALLLLLLAATEDISQRAETKATKQLVDSKTAEQAVDKAAQTKTVEQLADQVQDTGEQEANGGDDLEERLGEQAPERVELLLGVGHVGDLLLCVVDGGDDGRGELLEVVGEFVFLW